MLMYTKAIVGLAAPVIVAALLGVLDGIGIDGKMSVETAITAGVTGFFVWLLPNKQKA